MIRASPHQRQRKRLRRAADYSERQHTGPRICMDVFVARRAIFDPGLGVFAYRLLTSVVPGSQYAESPVDAVLQLINNSLFAFDPEALSGGKKLFYPFTAQALATGCAELLPPERSV